MAKTATAATVKAEILKYWSDQIVNERMRRLDDVALNAETQLTDREKHLYKMGLANGMAEILSTLKLQGLLTISYLK
jgi:hypothetical protein